MDNRPTIKELADQLNISIATVSRAFNQSGRISDITRKRVLEAAAAVGYRPNFSARQLGGRNTESIGFFYPMYDTESPDYFVGELQFGIGSELHKHGKSLLVMPFSSPEELELCRNRILDGSVSGVIIVAGGSGPRQLRALAEKIHTPCVVIGHMTGAEENCVLFDNEQGAFLAGQYFRNTNRKHPAYVGGYLDRRKRDGFLRGLKMAEQDVVFLSGGSGFRFGTQAFDEIAANHPEVDCVLCANDVLAIALVKRALEKKIRIPETLGVIGFDDIAPSRYFTPSITSVSLAVPKIGAAAARMLLQISEQKRNCRNLLLECDLILRQSS